MSEFLTQSELALRLESKTGINPETAKKFSSVFFSIVKKGLKNANTFSVYNFGTFKKTWIESSIGLNPQTGVKIEIPAHWRIKFVPCSSVAKRVNKKYANLKAKVIKTSSDVDEKISPFGLYAKASKLEEESKDETVSVSAITIIDEKIYESENGKTIIEEEKISVVPENQDDEIPESVNPDEIEDEDDEPENEIDEIDEDENEIDESEKKSKKTVILVLLGAAILVIVILVSILVKSCASKNSSKEKKPLEDEKELNIEETISENAESSERAENETSESENVSENESSSENAENGISSENKTTSENEKPELPNDKEISQSEELFESYVVKAGGCYNKIAEEKYKNRHLWPLIYSANKSQNVDPDFISSSASLKIPELPSNQDERNAKIAQSVLDAYNAYLLMCEKQPESTKNEMRRARAVRVLVSGEIVYPGFIDFYSSRILPEYAESAKNIVKNQYKM